MILNHVNNTFHAAGAGRQEQTTGLKVHQISQKMSKLFDFISNLESPHGEYIQISTNIPGIGLELFEIVSIL